MQRRKKRMRSIISEEQIVKWADEAEKGYNVEELKKRGLGHPGTSWCKRKRRRLRRNLDCPFWQENSR